MERKGKVVTELTPHTHTTSSPSCGLSTTAILVNSSSVPHSHILERKTPRTGRAHALATEEQAELHLNMKICPVLLDGSSPHIHYFQWPKRPSVFSKVFFVGSWHKRMIKLPHSHKTTSGNARDSQKTLSNNTFLGADTFDMTLCFTPKYCKPLNLKLTTSKMDAMYHFGVICSFVYPTETKSDK